MLSHSSGRVDRRLSNSSVHLASLAENPYFTFYHRDSCTIEDRDTNPPSLPAQIPRTQLRTHPTLNYLSALLARPHLSSYSAFHLLRHLLAVIDLRSLRSVLWDELYVL